MIGRPSPAPAPTLACVCRRSWRRTPIKASALGDDEPGAIEISAWGFRRSAALAGDDVEAHPWQVRQHLHSRRIEHNGLATSLAVRQQ